MAVTSYNQLLSQSYDLLIVVHPHIKFLDYAANQFISNGIFELNIGKELSKVLISVPSNERSRFTQNWMVERLANNSQSPVLCVYPDLLFEPHLEIDPLLLFRQVARSTKLILLWPGEFSENQLSYAIPEHHHYRTWNISDSLLHQPVVVIHRFVD